MFSTVLGLVRNDIERQLEWAQSEAKRQASSAALTAGFAAAGGIALLGTAIVGLMALYTWALPLYGPLIALAIVAGVTAVIAVACLCFAFMRGNVLAPPRPAIRSTDPSALKAAVGQDISDQSQALLASIKGTALGSVMVAGEDALNKGEDVLQMTQDFARDSSRPTVFGALALAALVGMVVGRRV